MQIEIPNELGFALLKHVPTGMNVQQAAVKLLQDIVHAPGEKTFAQLSVESNRKLSVAEAMASQFNKPYEG